MHSGFQRWGNNIYQIITRVIGREFTRSKDDDRVVIWPKIEDKLVATKFNRSITRGFAAVGEPKVAVCLLPGTEIVFDENVECEPSFGVLPNKKIGQRLARFRQVNLDNPVAHHDALEFPDGQVVLVTRLCAGQCATVLQLPAGARAATMESAVVEPELREISLLL